MDNREIILSRIAEVMSRKYFVVKNNSTFKSRLKFIGNPKELIGHWIFWWILIVITFGLYGLVVKIRFQQWTSANTIFEDVEIK